MHQYKQLLEGSQVQGLSGRLQTAISAEFKACWQAGKTQDPKPANPFSSVGGQADSILSSNLLRQSLRDFWFQAGQQDQHAAALFLKHSVMKLLAGPLDSDLVERISDIGIKILNNHSLELVDKQERLSFCIDYLLAIQKQSEPGREFKLDLFSQVLLTPEGLPRFPSALICVEQELMQAISGQPGSAAAFIDDRLLYSENAIKSLCYSSTMLGEQSQGSRFSSQRAPLMFTTLADDLRRHVIDQLCERPELIKCFLLENKGAVLSHLFYESPDLLDRLLDRLAEFPEQLKHCLTTPVIGKCGAADLIAMMMANPLSKENVWLRMQQAHMTRAEQVNIVVCIDLSRTLHLQAAFVKQECNLLTSALQGNGKPVKHFPRLSVTPAIQALSNVSS